MNFYCKEKYAICPQKDGEYSKCCNVCAVINCDSRCKNEYTQDTLRECEMLAEESEIKELIKSELRFGLNERYAELRLLENDINVMENKLKRL